MRDVSSWKRFLGVFAIALFCQIPSVLADGFEVAFFTLEHNRANGVLEIVHRLYQADVEIALSELEGHEVVIEGTPSNEVLIQSYIDARFSLSTPAGETLNTHWQGMELNAGTLFVRQHVTLPQNFESLVIRNAILIDTHDKQVNMMHANIWDQYFRRDFMAGGVVQRLNLAE